MELAISGWASRTYLLVRDQGFRETISKELLHSCSVVLLGYIDHKIETELEMPLSSSSDYTAGGKALVSWYSDR